MQAAQERAVPVELVDVLRLWQVDPAGYREPLEKSAPRWLELPGAGTAVGVFVEEAESASRVRFAALVREAVESLGITWLVGDALQDAALEAACRAHVAGELSPRELTYWVTRVIGLRGTERCRPFLRLEDEYTRFAAYDVSEIDADVTVEATECLTPQAPKRVGVLGRLFKRS